jgi:hypothetical protein
MAKQLVKNKNTYSNIRKDTFHTTLYIDYEFSESEKDIITAAAYDWQTSTKHVAQFDIVYLPSDVIDLTKGILILKTNEFDPDIILLDHYSNIRNIRILGFCRSKTAIPFIKIVASRLNLKNYKTVVTHELGHLVGLSHTDEPDTLMYPIINLESLTISDYDLENFCKLYKCK